MDAQCSVSFITDNQETQEDRRVEGPKAAAEFIGISNNKSLDISDMSFYGKRIISGQKDGSTLLKLP